MFRNNHLHFFASSSHFLLLFDLLKEKIKEVVEGSRIPPSYYQKLFCLLIGHEQVPFSAVV